MAVREFLSVRFDVTDLSSDERSALCGELSAQAERSDGHPSVPMEDIEIDEVEVVDEGDRRSSLGTLTCRWTRIARRDADALAKAILSSLDDDVAGLSIEIEVAMAEEV